METNRLEHYRKLASRAFEDGDYREAHTYYSLIYESSPEDVDAIFHRGLSRAWQSSIYTNDLLFANKGMKRAIEIIQKNGSTKEQLYLQINHCSIQIYKAITSIVDMVRHDYRNPEYRKESVNEFWGHMLDCIDSLDDIISYHSNEMIQSKEIFLKNKLVYLKELVNLCIEVCDGKKYKEYSRLARGTINEKIQINEDTRAKLVNKYELAVNEVRKYESYYKPKKIKSTSGCYIATAVYGDYDAPEVLVLRKFRDQVLKKYILGRTFIKIYYTVSPPLARKLRNQKSINSGVKRVLDQIVKKLTD
jgi:hypothetical protein